MLIVKNLRGSSLVRNLSYINRRRINAVLSATKRKVHVKDSLLERYKEQNEEILLKSNAEIHRKDMMLKDKQVRLEKITSLVQASPYKDKSKLIKIEDLVASDKFSESWEVFYENYQYKYPHGEKSIRTAFPTLTLKDYQYLMCVHYGLSHEKMATLFTIQKGSVNKRCLRIKQAFGISPSTNLKNFLLSHIMTD